MTTRMLKTAAASAALLIAASFGGQAFAQSYGGYGQAGQAQPAYDQRGGYDQGGDQAQDDQGQGGYGAPGGYDRQGGARGFNDRGFDQRGGRFNGGGDVRQRLQQVEQWAHAGARSGQLSRRQADRVFGMLQQLRLQVRGSGRDGFMSPREQMMLNGRLDRVVRFIQTHQGRMDAGRRY